MEKSETDLLFEDTLNKLNSLNASSSGENTPVPPEKDCQQTSKQPSERKEEAECTEEIDYLAELMIDEQEKEEEALADGRGDKQQGKIVEEGGKTQLKK